MSLTGKVVLSVLFLAFFILPNFVSAQTVVSGNISTDTTWSLSSSPYVIMNDISISSGVTLNIEPGVVVKFYNSYVALNIEGTLNAIGTPDAPIVFTSYKDDTVGGDTNGDGNASFPGVGTYLSSGDWRAMVFHAGSFATLRHTSIRYGGQYFYNGTGFSSFPMIRNEGGTLVFKDVDASSHSMLIDTYNQTEGNTSMENVKIGYTRTGIIVSGGTFTAHNSILLGSNYALKNDSTNNIDAINNWWGSSSGPSHDTNPDGGGSRIFGDVSFTPWLNTDPSAAVVTLNAITTPTVGITNADLVFKVIYTNSFNQAPTDVRLMATGDNLGAPCQATGGGGVPMLMASMIIIGEDYGCVMNVDENATASLHDGDFSNGEQYIIALQFPAGTFSYYFKADNTYLYSPESSEFPLVVSDGPAACLVNCNSNVLFLPGLEASRLYKQGILSEDRLWEPNMNSDVVDLYLNQSGQSINNVYTKDIVDKGLGISPVYDSFIKKMDQLVVNNKIKEWQPYAYDWRQDVEDIVNNGTKYKDGQKSIVATLEELANSSVTGKVTIVAHSNGGLLAKALLAKLQNDKIAGQNNLIDKIDNVVLVASPQVGTPEAIFAILHGYNQKILGGFLMNTQTARQLSINMPSGYGLLPSEKYYQIYTTPIISFDQNSSLSQTYTNYYGSDINSFTKQNDFILGKEGRTNPNMSDTILPIIGNEPLLNKSNALHNKIDNLIIPSNIKLIQLAGWGKDTLVGIKYVEKTICEYSLVGLNICIPKKILDLRPVTDMNGDKTVVAPSALYDDQGQKYWLDLSSSKIEHKNIFEDNSILQFIENVITKNTLATDGIYQQKPEYTKIRNKISVHSPITLGAYDSLGNFTGKVCDINSDFCQIIEDIPNSSYMEFGEGKYLNADEENINKIMLQGTDIGTFTYESARVLPSGQSATTTFIDIPVTTQTKAEITLNTTTQMPELFLDVTGDGKVDFIITPEAEFDPILFLQIMRKTVESFDISKQQKNNLLKRIDDTIKAIQKGKINKAKLKIEQFRKALTIHPKESDEDRQEREKENEQEHEKEHKENEQPKQLSSADIQTLLTMLNQLLDNLNK